MGNNVSETDIAGEEENWYSADEDTGELSDPTITKANLAELPVEIKSFLQQMATVKNTANKQKESLNMASANLSIGYNMADMYNTSEFSDVIVRVAGSNRRLQLHKNILASHSAYFKELFAGNDCLSEPGKILVLQAPGELHGVYKNVLEFLYTGKVTVDKYSVFKYYFMAELLTCEDLRRLCVRYLKQQLAVQVQEAVMTLVIPGHTYTVKETQSNPRRRLLNRNQGSETVTEGRSEHDVTVSKANPVAKAYTAAEVLAFWRAVSDCEVSHAASFWIASQVNHEFKIINLDLTTQLSLSQISAVLDCDVNVLSSSYSEVMLFRFATQWLNKHPEQNADSLLLKVRYAYMSQEQREQVLESQHVTASPAITQAVINATFYFNLMFNSKSLLDKMIKTFPDFSQKIYQPRKCTQK